MTSPSDDVNETPDNPKWLKSPMNALPVPKAKLYPHKTHTMLTIAIDMKLIIIVLTRFLARTKPP